MIAARYRTWARALAAISTLGGGLRATNASHDQNGTCGTGPYSDGAFFSHSFRIVRAEPAMREHPARRSCLAIRRLLAISLSQSMSHPQGVTPRRCPKVRSAPVDAIAPRGAYVVNFKDADGQRWSLSTIGSWGHDPGGAIIDDRKDLGHVGRVRSDQSSVPHFGGSGRGNERGR